MAYPYLLAAGNGLAANNWTTCNGGAEPAAGDTIFLADTNASLYLNGVAGRTYTCAAVKAFTNAGMGTPTHGHIVGSGIVEAAPGPVLNFEIWAGTVTMLTLAATKYISSVKKAVAGTAASAHGINNSGTITTVTEAIGGSIRAAYGIYNAGIITTVTAATGGSVSGAWGIYNSAAGAITNPIGTAKGGTNANPALAISAFAVVSIPTIIITIIDNSGSCPAVGVEMRLPTNTWVGSYNAAGTARQTYVPTGTVVAAANVRSGVATYTGGPTGTAALSGMGPYPVTSAGIGPYKVAPVSVGPLPVF